MNDAIKEAIARSTTEIIKEHLEAWNNAEGHHLSYATGFVAWAHESLMEVAIDLQTEDPQIGDDLAYSIAQDEGSDVTAEEAMAWVLDHKEELLQAIKDEARDSMPNDDLREFREEALAHGDTEGAEICSRALGGSLLDRLDVLGMKMSALAMCD